MDFKIVEDIDISKEEMEYLENHDFGEEMRNGLEDGSTIVSDGSWEETVKAIKAKKAREATQMASFRIPKWIMEPPGTCARPLGDLQGIQQEGRGGRAADTPPAPELRRPGIRLGGIQARSGNQRPGHHDRPAARGTGHPHRRAFQGQPDGRNEETHGAGQSQQRLPAEGLPR